MDESRLPESVRKYLEEARKEIELMNDPEYRRAKQIKELEEMKPFNRDNCSSVKSIPQMNESDYNEYVIPNYIRCGAIPKSKLVDGKKYYGKCRNAEVACWDEKLGKFTYNRFKWGETYIDTINHFEDDNGYDLFVPLKLYYEE